MSTRSQPVFAIVTGLVVATVMVIILSTTGRSAAAEQQLLGRLDTAGSRVIQISATTPKPTLDTTMLKVASGLSDVEWALGFSQPQDGIEHAVGPGGEPIAVWTMYGNPPPNLMHINGTHETGTALLGRNASAKWSSTAHWGAFDLPRGAQVPLVGTVDAQAPLDFLNEGAVTLGDQSVGRPVARFLISARSVEAVPDVISQLSSIIDVPPTDIRVTSPEVLAQLHSALAGDLGGFGRDLLAAALLAGSALIGVTVLGQVLIRRKDLGRRRALGCSRSLLIQLVVAQTLIAAVLGAVTGAVIGCVITWRTAGTVPGPGFILGTLTLTILGAAVAALPAALSAAFRDPITVLRTP